MIKMIVYGIIIIFSLTTAVYAEYPIKQTTSTTKTAVNYNTLGYFYNLTRTYPPRTTPLLVTPRVYKSSNLQYLDIYMPMPAERTPHVHQGKLYRNLHYSKRNSPIHKKRVTLKPYQ